LSFLPGIGRLAGRIRAGRLRRCPACGARWTNLQRLGTVAVTQDGHFSRDRFGLVHCRRSDLVYLDPLPEPGDFAEMYGGAQFGSDEYTSERRVAAMLEYYETCIGRHFRVAGFPRFRLLEIGAGLAWVSRALKRVAPESVTHAQDVSTECAVQCPWVDEYTVGSVEDVAGRRPGPYQAISLTHVIEHLPDPVATLGVLATLLDERGVILVTAPHRPSSWTVEQGIGPWLVYSYLHVPAHITYFSEKGLAEAAAKAGLEMRFWEASSEEGQAFEAVLGRRA